MNDWLPSLNALRAFEAVSRHLSYRDAAEELRVTPAAVKQLVRKLEDALGAPLVRRRGRGIALTGAGVAGLADLHDGFGRISGAVEKMRRVERRGSLTVSVEPSFAAAWLVPRLDAFKRRHPDIDVLIDASLRIVDLERGAADLGIRYGVKPDRAQVVHRLFDDETLAVCSPALAEGPPPLERLSDLAHVTLIHMTFTDMTAMPVSMHWFDWRTWFAEVGAGEIEPGGTLRFNDYNLTVQAAIAGQGVVLGSWPILRDAIEANLLVSPFDARARTDVGYDLVMTRDAMARPEVAAFVEWILGEIEKDSGGPDG
ncbi:MAG: LysR substrate-binding domain-containing protein [Kiloniellales bacterium]